MKRCLAFLLALLLLAMSVSALADQEIACQCGSARCECFLQKGDEGVGVKGATGALKSQGFLKKQTSTFDATVEKAVKAFQKKRGLPQTGMLDDMTLTLLLQGCAPDQLPDEGAVWVPVEGGKKFHKSKKCSSMKHPRLMRRSNAKAMGIDACKRCAN